MCRRAPPNLGRPLSQPPQCVPPNSTYPIYRILFSICILYRRGSDGTETSQIFSGCRRRAEFRRAAEKLGIAQPPLSSQIHDLENEIGVQLFRRIPKGAELTEAGVAFLSAVPAVFDKVERAVTLAQKGGRGEVGQLRVGYTGSAAFNQIVPESLRAFRRAYPSVELTLEELNSPQLLDQLNRQRLDAVFIRPGKEPPPGFTITAPRCGADDGLGAFRPPACLQPCGETD
jgi:DNA-binding transcriptional LysR family regulator